MALQWPLRVLLVLAHWTLGLIPWILSPIFAWIYEKKKGQTPKPQDALTPTQVEIISTPASVLAHKIRTRELRSVEVVEAFIARIKQVNGCLNAVIDERYNAALSEAEEVDRRLDSGDLPDAWKDAPFLGVPFTSKEAFAIKGLFHTSGLVSRRGLRASVDAPVIARLRTYGGAIPLAITNVSELCMWYESANLIYGRSNNAYHHGRIVGGSSGGEGCILSAAGSVIGVGSDIGGSIRMPAFFNGIFGHKPSKGIVDNTGQFPNAENEAQTFLSTGPMCRYACDLEPMLKVMAGPEGVEAMKLDEKVDLHRVKFYYMEDDGGSLFVSPVNDQLKQAIHKAVSHFEGNFHGVIAQKASLKKLKLSLPIWMMKMASSENTPFCTLMGGGGGNGDGPNNGQAVRPLVELAYWLCQMPRHTLPAIGLGLLEKSAPNDRVVQYMRRKCEELKKDIADLLGDTGVLLYPTHPIPAPYHNQPLTLINNFAYTGIFNVLGLPATAVPLGIGREGVPLGLQVVAGHLQDRLALAVTQELENAFGGWVPPY